MPPNTYPVPGSFFSAMGELEAARQRVDAAPHSYDHATMMVTLPRDAFVNLLLAAEKAFHETAQILEPR